MLHWRKKNCPPASPPPLGSRAETGAPPIETAPVVGDGRGRRPGTPPSDCGRRAVERRGKAMDCRPRWARGSEHQRELASIRFRPCPRGEGRPQATLRGRTEGPVATVRPDPGVPNLGWLVAAVVGMQRRARFQDSPPEVHPARGAVCAILGSEARLRLRQRRRQRLRADRACHDHPCRMRRAARPTSPGMPAESVGLGGRMTLPPERF